MCSLFQVKQMYSNPGMQDYIIEFNFSSSNTADLAESIQSSFTPQPSTVTLESVVDAKGWMQHVIPSLHDHLKAHQFKFQRNELGECRMFYKEWSTDNYWLPQSGLALLPQGMSI